jgi:hypothetical protein
MPIADMAASLDTGGFTIATPKLDQWARLEPTIVSWFMDWRVIE